jgi:hypothetical protein
MLRKVLVFGLLGSALMFAQRGGGGGGRGGGGGSMVPQGSFGPVNKLDRITDMLKLSKDQKKDLKQIFDEAQKEATPLHDQINKARLVVAEAVTGGKSPEELQKAVDAEGALETQMSMLEMKAFARFATGLEPDQQPRASQLFLMMRGLFSNKNWNSD